MYRKDNNSIPLSVGNATGQTDVANMRKCHYSGLLNSKKCYKIFVDNFLTRRSSFCNTCIVNFQCTAPMTCNLIKKLPLQKSAGADGMTAQHLRYAHYCVCIYSSVLFNLRVNHGFIPDDYFITDVVPILKCKNKDATNVGNYRPIAVATTISKLFEHFILFHIKPFLSTSDHQFGFKRGTGTDMCIFLLKQIISPYLQEGSPIFSVFLDASKAFDRVSHEFLFKKLLLRDVSPCFIRLLRY